MRTTSKRQYTAVVQEVQVPWGGIAEWLKQNNEINTRLGETSTVLRELYGSGHKMRALKHLKAVAF